MRNPTIIFTLMVTILLLGGNISSIDKSNMVNPLLGDISYESAFGHKPDATTDNNLIVTCCFQNQVFIILPVY